jgi:hypothetical protein
MDEKSDDWSKQERCAPVSQVCAFILLSSIVTTRVATSTPIVDLLSRLNPVRLRTNQVGYVQFLRGQKDEDRECQWWSDRGQ